MATTGYQYLAEKIEAATFATEPFEHLVIDDFLSDAHDELVQHDEQVHPPPVATTEELIETLQDRDYEVRSDLAGVTWMVKEYLRCANAGKWPVDREGFGLVLRIRTINDPVIRELVDFLDGPVFRAALEAKFDLPRNTTSDIAIQKYLTGYAQNPHPDIRRKALTILLNISSGAAIESLPVHTQLLRFKPERDYVSQFWEGNPDVERCHVPWDWCATEKQTNRNNSILIFRPTNRTLHAVKAMYDHTRFQRTHVYSNLWYDDVDAEQLVEISSEDLDPRVRDKRPTRAPTRVRVSRASRRAAARVRDSLRR